ncbi:hypothetical protein [Thiobacillus sp.]
MNTHNTHPLPTLPQLIKATGLALAAAAAILVTTVLPAEHDIDPTGIGKALGLTTLSASGGETTLPPLPASTGETQPGNPTIAAPATPTPAAIVAKSKVPYRSEEMMLTLQPDEGAEIKASMRQGEQFVFTWAAEGGKVNFDMHGERPNAGDEFTSYWKDKQQTDAQGTFVAPFDGTHGWYWRNHGDKPVTVKVKVSGFYEKLYRP